MFRPRLALRSPLSCHPERSEGSVSHILLPPAPHSAPTRSIRRRELLPLTPVTNHQSPVTKSFTVRTYAKPARNPFRIRTSKTQHLKPFRMNTYEKTGGGPPFQRRSSPRRLALHYSTDAKHNDT